MTAPPTDEALALCREVAFTDARVSATIDRALSGSHGLSSTDLTILSFLAEGPMRRIDLADRIGMSASGVSRALLPLERIGVVERNRDPHDARASRASLTDAGRELLAHGTETAGERAAALVGERLTAEEVVELRRLLARLVR